MAHQQPLFIAGVIACLDEFTAGFIKDSAALFNEQGNTQIGCWHYWEREATIIIGGFLHAVIPGKLEPNHTMLDLFRMNSLPTEVNHFDITAWKKLPRGIYLEFECRNLLLQKLSSKKVLRTPTGVFKIKKRLRKQLSKKEYEDKFAQMDAS